MNLAVQELEPALEGELDSSSSVELYNLLDARLKRYAQQKRAILNVAAFMLDENNRNACAYFLHASDSDAHRITIRNMESVFVPEKAIAHLNATYWNDLLRESGLFDILPEKRRNEWHEIIKAARTPPFEEHIVLSTLENLFIQRKMFFAERIDGVFQALSRSHVTNRPEGFSRRMIIYADNYYNTGYIHDLRCVIARIRGIKIEPSQYATSNDIRFIPRNGKWHDLDGGSLRIRRYIKGTAHLEVDDSIARTLNQYLAILYPNAIPSNFRKAPQSTKKPYAHLNAILPYPVINYLHELRHFRFKNGKYVHSYPFGRFSSNVREIAGDVLILLGATLDRENYAITFDYDPVDVLAEVCRTGTIPHKKSHQFYPTPPALAQRVVEAAGIGAEHRCLEPNAGTGSLARLMPKDRTCCIEINRVFCSILEAMGHDTIQSDFLVWSRTTNNRFDRIVMNPPYTEGQWLQHVNAALNLLLPSGRLVAVLPSGAAARLQPAPGVVYSWEGPFHNAFPDASVSVVILTATRTL